MNKYANELTVEALMQSPEPGTLILEAQGPSDAAKLDKICPRDQVRHFKCQWSQGRALVFEQVQIVDCPDDGLGRSRVAPEVAEEIKRLAGLRLPDLKTLAGERNVRWDPKASPETMLERIAIAALPNSPPK